MQGLGRWIISRAQLGEPYYDADGYVQERKTQGCIWVGSTGSPLTREDRESIAQSIGLQPDEIRETKGEIQLFLDFTERRVVRDDLQPADSPDRKPRVRRQ